MSSDELLQKLRRIVDEAGGNGNYMCPCCFYRLTTHEEKVRHLEKVHGYEMLQVEPLDG